MKTLITLSVLQTIGIAALIVHAFHESPQVVPGAGAANRLPTTMSAVAPAIDEERLRAVVREELARLSLAAETPPAVVPQPRNADADRQRRELIEQQIDTYSSAGAITDVEMTELQAEIAKLDEPSRRQMMSMLVRALNSGDIKGRL